MSRSSRARHRLDRSTSPTLQNWRPFREQVSGKELRENAIVECGWGRLIFGHTFRSPQRLAATLLEEAPGQRDIGFYIRDPHILLAVAPQELFLDPSHTYRLWLARYRPASAQPRGFSIRRLRTRAEAEAMGRVYRRCHMVPPEPGFVYANRKSRLLTYLVAIDDESEEVIGCVNGVDHEAAFDDPETGSSLWSLAVDPQAHHPGIGESLVRRLAEHYMARGRSYMDISVLHDNAEAIALYEKLDSERVPVFCVKRRNRINEPLFTAAAIWEEMNPYARIIVDEARRRGISVEVLDAEAGYFRLSHGGRHVTCRESLSDLTSAIAMSRCDDKAVTRRVLAAAGLNVPDQRPAGDAADNETFLRRHGSLVVKPVRGEQGRGVAVDISSAAELEDAIRAATAGGEEAILEQYVSGQDLRVIVIDYKVVAGALRRSAQVVGSGRHTVRSLIEKQSRRRSAATGGESRIPLDAETKRCVEAGGFSLEDTPPQGEILQVRKSANLHTGGTIHDVTERLHPALIDAAERAARALETPVVGLDLIVADPAQPDYAIIEANERPGLANHEPAPTAERFVDLLFPETARPPELERAGAGAPGAGGG